MKGLGRGREVHSLRAGKKQSMSVERKGVCEMPPQEVWAWKADVDGNQITQTLVGHVKEWNN